MERQKARQLEESDKKYIWHPFTQMKDWETETPLIIERGEGNYLIDIHGRRYLDGISSLWVTVHGHRKKEIDDAIKAQVDRISHSTLLGLSNVPAIKLAEKLVGITPPNLTKVFYSDSGSTAAEVALKIAYQYAQQTENNSRRKKFLTFQNAYHGDTIGSVSVGGIDLFHKVYRPLLFETIQANFSNAEQLIEKHHQELAGIIIEPMIQGAAGMLLQPRGFLRHLRQACDRYHVLLIFDEVATGFGRTGKMFACEHEQVWPDLMCVAKGISGGYLPIAATLTTEAVYQGFYADYQELKTFFHGHTYTGNPLACAAAVANLKIFETERTIEKLQPKVEQLSEGLRGFYSHPHVREVRQLGFMVGLDLGKNKNDPHSWEEKIGIQVILEARRLGVILRPLGSVIVLMPPLSITADELDFLLQTTRTAIDKICGS